MKWKLVTSFLPFFFPFQKNCCAEPRIVLLVVSLLWLLAKTVFSAWNILLGD